MRFRSPRLPAWRSFQVVNVVVGTIVDASIAGTPGFFAGALLAALITAVELLIT